MPKIELKNLVAIMIVSNSAVVLTDPEIGGIFAAKVDYILNAFDEPDIMHVKQLHSTTSCNTN